MKGNKSVLLAFVLLILVASLYRVWAPYGFAPQLAMAIFAGAVIKDRKWAILLPIGSLFLSDLLFQGLYMNGISDTPGFYGGQWINYLLIAGLTVYGFLMKKVNTVNVLGFTISGSVLFFLLSNFTVWLGGGGFHRPKTFEGLMQCYGDGLAFFRDYGVIKGFYGNMIIGDLFFSGLLFGAFYLIGRFALQPEKRLA